MNLIIFSILKPLKSQNTENIYLFALIWNGILEWNLFIPKL